VFSSHPLDPGLQHFAIQSIPTDISLHFPAHRAGYYSAADRAAEYYDDRVCLSVCVCLSASMSLEIHVRSLPFLHVTYDRGSVLLWWRCHTLYTSGFVDDVKLAHKLRQLNVTAQLIEAQPTCSLRLGYKRRVGIPVAGQWTHTHGPTFQAPRSGTARPQWAC